jgi:hypothetical protein
MVLSEFAVILSLLVYGKIIAFGGGGLPVPGLGAPVVPEGFGLLLTAGGV